MTEESNEKNVFNWIRIRHLLKLGILSAVMVLIGDMLLGWGRSDPSVTEIPAIFTRYLAVSDGRIFASALLGLIGIPVECLCWFAVYRILQPYSPKEAHLFRGGILGCLAFGGCGVHVPCCMAVYLLKHFYHEDPSSVVQNMSGWILWFLAPATVIFAIFFFLAAVVQFRTFLRGGTPYPRWCCIFSLLFGLVWMILMRWTGDHPLANALATGWISAGNIWMMGGLLVQSKTAEQNWKKRKDRAEAVQ